jgi:hypothetical protein
MKFAFDVPPGWVESPYPPPHRGIYLHAPPGGLRGAMLMMDAITSRGTLAEQLADAVRTGTQGTQLLGEGDAIEFTTRSQLAGLSIPTIVRVTHEGRTRDEVRVFTLVDAGAIRLPVVFLGDVGAPDAYELEIGLVLYTIRPLESHE